MPTVTIKLFSSLARFLPPGAEDNQARLEMPDGTTVGAVIRHLRLPGEHCHLVLLNGSYVPPGLRDSTVAGDGDAVAVWPPVAGG